MMTTFIYLAEACQNRFLIVDCLGKTSLSADFFNEIHACLLLSERDDALILVNGLETNDSLSMEMLVLGADKKFGDFCGNGSRACAAYLYNRYPQYEQFFIRAQGKNRLLRKEGQHHYSVELPLVNFIPNKKFIAQNEVFHQENDFCYFSFENKKFYYADILEPHLILNEQLTSDAIHHLGLKFNNDKNLFPLGINLTVFYKNKEENFLQAVTFERGVQRLTKSCGTGACCAAAFYLKGKPGKVTVNNPGGMLKILNQGNWVQLKGPGLITGNYRLNMATSFS